MKQITFYLRNLTIKWQVLSLFVLPLGCTLSAQQFVNKSEIDWVKVADFGGGAICGGSTFTINDYAYVCVGNGGGYTPSYKRICYRYDPKMDVWKRLADLPTTANFRQEGVGFSIIGKGYITGGMYEGLASFSYPIDTWEYDPIKNLWYQRSNFPRIGGIWKGTAFSIDSLGYVGLGIAGFVDSYHEPGEKNDFYQFNPKTNKWTQLNDFPGAPRSGAVGFSMNGKGYVGLGYRYDLGSGFNFYTDFWEYDPITDEWTRLPDFPGEGRTNAIGFGLDGECYLGLGQINDFYKYNLETKTWESLNYLPCGVREFTNSFLVNNGIYYGGGSYSYSPYSDFWLYQLKDPTNIPNLIVRQSNRIFPNPVDDYLHINELDELAEVKIIDLHGRVVLQSTISNSLGVFVGCLAKGIYLVKVKNSKEEFDEKLVKK